MYSTHFVLPDGTTINSHEQKSTNRFLLCALRVIHLHKDHIDLREHSNEIDGFIAKAYLKKVIQELISDATQWLLSPLPTRQERGRFLVELLSDKELEHYPEYKAYRHLLQAIIGEAPLMRLHLQALQLVATESRTLRKRYKKATVTESILENFESGMQTDSRLSVTHQRFPLTG